MEQPNLVINHLFISKVRIDILKYFYTNEADEVHMREMTRIIVQELNAVRRELLRLTAIGALLVRKDGNRIYYKINKEFIFYNEIKSMIFKMYGLGGELLKKIDEIGNIRNVFLLKPYLEKKRSDSNNADIVIIGTVDLHKISAIIDLIQSKENREINYLVMNPNEFDLRVRRKDKFAWKMITDYKIELFGNIIKDITPLI